MIDQSSGRVERIVGVPIFRVVPVVEHSTPGVEMPVLIAEARNRGRCVVPGLAWVRATASPSWRFRTSKTVAGITVETGVGDQHQSGM